MPGQETVTRRDPYWDNLKGVLIFLVVFGHFLWELDTGAGIIHVIVSFIYMFHMQVFAFVSGRFGHGRSEESQSVIRLFILFVFLDAVMSLFWPDGIVLIPRAHAWYLLALCVWRLITKHVARFDAFPVVCAVAAIAIGFMTSVGNILAMPRILAFWPFYLLGYMAEGFDAGRFGKRGRVLISALSALLSAAMFLCLYHFFVPTFDDLIFLPYRSVEGHLFRAAGYFFAGGMLMFLLFAIPRCDMGFITRAGRYSLGIYFFHRPVTYLFRFAPDDMPAAVLVLAPFAACVLICALLGNRFTDSLLRGRFSDFFASAWRFLSRHWKRMLVCAGCMAMAMCIIAVLIPVSYEDAYLCDRMPERPIVSDDRFLDFDNAVRITFAGDLILLEDQVKLGYTGSGYDFSDVFEYASDYISSADLAIGVFEGPTAGFEAGYSVSNFDDGKAVYLNFPDEFAYAVRDAGFDLVTTANNHLLDKGLDGVMRTLDVLDDAGLTHVGSYRSQAERDTVCFVDVDGIKIAVLAYTYGVNYRATTDLLYGDYSYITGFAAGTAGDDFEYMKSLVASDFERARAGDPDLIMVLPHMGTQFSHEIDETQETWFDIFREFGADIILGDHAHCVQPARISVTDDGRNIFEAYCPGNFVNIYGEYGGYESALIDVYIDRDAKTVIGGSITPCYIQANGTAGNYRSLPIYDMFNDASLNMSLGRSDLEAAAEAYERITGAMLGSGITADNLSERVYFDATGYIRPVSSPVDLTEQRASNPFWSAVGSGESVCFVGDSITDGYANGNYPWFEPLERLIPGGVSYYSRGGATVKWMKDQADEIPQAGVYIVALGCNDIRYRDEGFCAYTPEEYVSCMFELKSALLGKSPEARFVFIAPWLSLDMDRNAAVSYFDKLGLYEDYSSALEDMCRENGDTYIDPNPLIFSVLSVKPESDYMLDAVHPNGGAGIRLYCEAVLDYHN